jgi:hypothetical protein
MHWLQSFTVELRYRPKSGMRSIRGGIDQHHLAQPLLQTVNRGSVELFIYLTLPNGVHFYHPDPCDEYHYLTVTLRHEGQVQLNTQDISSVSSVHCYCDNSFHSL